MADDVLARLSVEIDAKLAALNKQLDDVNRAVGRNADQIEAQTKRGEAAFGRLRSAVNAFAIAAAAALTAKVVQGFNAIPEAASNAERQFARLEGVITATGSAAGRSVQQIEALAQDIGINTLASTQAIRDAAAQLLTFKSVAGDTFDTTLRLAQDLAEAGFGSVESQALALGKALEDPVTGLTALRRSGVSFTEAQKELIKSLTETNRLAEAQGLILDAVAGQVGGTGAAAAYGTYAGAVDTAGERIKLFQEALGRELLPTLKSAQTAIASAAKFLTDNLAEALEVARVAAVGIGTAITAALVPALVRAAAATATFTAALATNPLFLAATAVGALAAAFVAYREEISAALGANTDLVNALEQQRQRTADLDVALRGTQKETQIARVTTQGLTGDALKAAQALLVERDAAEAAAVSLRQLSQVFEADLSLRQSLEEQAAALSVVEVQARRTGLSVQEYLDKFGGNFLPVLDAASAKVAKARDTLAGQVEAFREGAITAQELRDRVIELEAEFGGAIPTLAEVEALVSRQAAAAVRAADATKGSAAASKEDARAKQEQARGTDAAAQAQADLNERVRRFEAEPLINALQDVQRTLTDVFADAFRGTLKSLDDFADRFLDIVARLGANLLSQKLVIPIIATAGSAVGLSPSDLGIPEGVAGGGGLGGFDLGSILSSFGSTGSLGTALAGSALGTSQLGQALGLSTQLTLPSGVAVGSPVVANSALVNGLNAASSFAGAAGGIVGNLGANLIFGGDRGIGADIGGTIGSVAAPIIAAAIAGGPIGWVAAGLSALLGGFGGNFLGGLFGGQEPSNRLQTTRITGRAGDAIAQGQTGDKFSQANADLAGGIAQTANAFLASLEVATGSISEFSTVTGIAGDRSGALLDFFREDPGRGTGVTGDLRFNVEDELSVLTASLEAFLASAEDLDPLFREKLTAALDGTQEEITGLVNALGVFRSAGEALAALDPEPVNSYRAALDAINGPLDEQRRILEEAGLPLADLNELQRRLTDDLRTGFIDGLERANRALAGNGFLDAINDVVAGAADAFASAREVGGRAGALVAENLALTIGNALGELDVDQLGQLGGFLAAASDGSERYAIALGAVADELDRRDVAAKLAQLGGLAADALAGIADVAEDIPEVIEDIAAALNAEAIRGAFEDVFGAQTVADAALAAGLGDAVTAVLTGIGDDILPFTDAARAAGIAIEALTADEETRTAALAILSDVLAGNADATQAAADAAAEARARAAELAEAERELARARAEALADFEEQVISRTQGEDAARAFRLAQAGLGGFVDEVRAVATTGLEPFLDGIRVAGLSAEQIGVLGREALAVFDQAQRAAANTNAAIDDSFASLFASIAGQVESSIAIISDGAADAVAALRDSTERTIGALTANYAGRIGELERLQSSFISAGSGIAQALQDLEALGLNPEQGYALAAERFAGIASGAAAGSLGSLQALPGEIGSFLDAARLYGAEGTPQFAAALDQARAAGTAAMEAADRQAATLDARIDGLARSLSDQTARLERELERQVAEIEAAKEAQVAAIEAQGAETVSVLQQIAVAASQNNDIVQALVAIASQQGMSLQRLADQVADLAREQRAANDARAA